jgi:hypothetical protein
LVLADGRDPENVRFEVAVITCFVDAADLLGVPKSLAAIYGICFASPDHFSDLKSALCHQAKRGA